MRRPAANPPPDEQCQRGEDQHQEDTVEMLLEENIEMVQEFHEPVLETDLRSFTRHSKRFLWHPCWTEARWRRMPPPVAL